MKISTKTGDNGETGLFGGGRVKKSSMIMMVLGELDELQATLGWARIEVKSPDSILTLEEIIDDIYRMMSIVGFEFKVPKTITPIEESDVERLEKYIKENERYFEKISKFLRPGRGGEAEARLQLARCVARRVERAFVGCFDDYQGPVLKYLNRLSDMLFVAAIKEGFGLADSN